MADKYAADRGTLEGIDLLVGALPALLAMTRDERQAFLDYYVAGVTGPETSGRLGLSCSRVEQLRKLARNRVGDHLAPLAEAA